MYASFNANIACANFHTAIHIHSFYSSSFAKWYMTWKLFVKAYFLIMKNYSISTVNRFICSINYCCLSKIGIKWRKLRLYKLLLGKSVLWRTFHRNGRGKKRYILDTILKFICLVWDSISTLMLLQVLMRTNNALWSAIIAVWWTKASMDSVTWTWYYNVVVFSAG